MAEKDDNPFSFKNFVSRNDSEDSSESQEESSSEKADGPLVVPPGAQTEQKKEENPFSFKQFLKHQEAGAKPKVKIMTDNDLLDNGKKNHQERYGGARPKHGTRLWRESDRQKLYAAPDIANNLPDFVQDHFHHEFPQRCGSDEQLMLDLEVNLPEFAARHSRENHRCGRFNEVLQEEQQSQANNPLDYAHHASEACSRDAGIQELDLVLPDLPDEKPSARQHCLEEGNKVPGLDLNLPDFALELGTGSQSADNMGSADRVDYATKGKFLNELEPVNHDDKHENSNRDPVMHSRNDIAMSTSLPDFLSDGPMPGSTVHLHASEQSSTSSGSVRSDDVLQLQRRNNELQHRISFLEQELVVQKKKEEEETSALEAMMHQVENNLKVTTKRAVASEETARKLKQEIKSLHTQVSHLLTENEMLKGSMASDQMSSVQESARSAAHQLEAAANTAEHQLKQMLNGVESLKLISKMLGNIDKISEQNRRSDCGASSL